MKRRTRKKVKIPFEPFDKQVGPCLSEAPICVCVSGARGGKTQIGAFKAAITAIEQPGYLKKDISQKEPYVIGIGAPTYPMLNRVILPTVLRYIPDPLKIGKYHQTEKRLRVRGKYGETVIYFISARYWESWYGLKLSYAWVDEFALIKETMFDELQARLSDVKGRLFLTGTPQGPNWALSRLYEPWAEGRDRWGEGGDIDFYTWTTFDNPYIDRHYLEQKRAKMPERYFRRTFLASWDTFEGQVYEDFLREIHVRPRSEFTFVLPSGRPVGNGAEVIYLSEVVAGVDWGFAPGHPGVIVILGKDHNGRYFILDESVEEGVLVAAEPGVDSWVARARSYMVAWDIKKFYCDTASPESITQFRRAGVPAVAAQKAVKEGIATVARFLKVDERDNEPLMMVLSDCTNTIDEFLYYHWQTGKEEPAKVNDHCMDAIRYAVHTNELRGRFVREPNYNPS